MSKVEVSTSEPSYSPHGSSPKPASPSKSSFSYEPKDMDICQMDAYSGKVPDGSYPPYSYSVTRTSIISISDDPPSYDAMPRDGDISFGDYVRPPPDDPVSVFGVKSRGMLDGPQVVVHQNTIGESSALPQVVVTRRHSMESNPGPPQVSVSRRPSLQTPEMREGVDPRRVSIVEGPIIIHRQSIAHPDEHQSVVINPNTLQPPNDSALSGSTSGGGGRTDARSPVERRRSVVFRNNESSVRRRPYSQRQRRQSCKFEDEEETANSTYTWTVIGSILYAVILNLFGLAFPIAEAIRREWLTSHHVGIFLTYIFLVSCIFIVFLEVVTYREESKERQKRIPDEVVRQAKKEGSRRRGLLKKTYSNLSLLHRPSHAKSMDDGLPHIRIDSSTTIDDDDGSSVDGSVDQTCVEDWEELYAAHLQQKQCSSLNHESGGFYLRLGCLLFGIGNFIYVLLEIAAHYEIKECYTMSLVYPRYFQLLFLLTQTFFLFKSTKIHHLSKWRGVVRFGLLHCLSTNLCIWFRVLVREVLEAYHHDSYEYDKHNNDSLADSSEEVLGAALNLVISASASASVEVNDSLEGGETPNHVVAHPCYKEPQLVTTVTPFLFPFVLEYSLIAVAHMADMYHTLNIRFGASVMNSLEQHRKTCASARNSHFGGHQTSNNVVATLADVRKAVQKCEQARAVKEESGFTKSHRGMYLGAILLTGASTSIIFFNIHDHDEYQTSMLIHNITDIVIQALMLSAIVLAYTTFRNFKFTFRRDHAIDDTLLILSLGGVLILGIFSTMASFATLTESPEEHADNLGAVLGLVASFLMCIEAVIQTAFIIDGMQRCPLTKRQETDKPGRGVLAFLIIGNVSIWIFKSFHVKDLGLGVMDVFYGPIAWVLIENMSLPLLLFYRFHSSICLAIMWATVYTPEDEENHHHHHHHHH